MRRFFVALVVLAAARFSADASAQAPQSAPYVWKSVHVGAGGFIPGIVFSRAQKGLVYLRSDMGGCYRWDDAAKTWIPLQDAMPQSSYFGGESIAPDPIDPNLVYVASGMYRGDGAAMLRSRDRGTTWEIFPVGFRMGGNEDGRGAGERLAIDPNQTSTLYFASRHDGLQRSTDSAQTWQQIESFPLKGLGTPPPRARTHTGLSFVVFDPHSGAKASPTPTIFVGNADPGEHHLFRSTDAGKTWAVVSGEPRADLLPLKAEIDDDGILYITYSNNAGPNGATDGAVMKLDTHSGVWTDITPEKGAARRQGGYIGISIDRGRKGTLGVTTLDHWSPTDNVWRTADGGATWHDIAAKSARDVSATPYLLWGKPEARLGWWLAAFAIDPFDSNFAVYATGATVYASHDFSNTSSEAPTHWSPWVSGIEQTAIITLCSPSQGAHLLSGFGDIGGFVHDDLDVSPPSGMFLDPQFTNTNTIDYAEKNPSVIVRSGRPGENQAALGFSEDGGKSWSPLTAPPDVSSHSAPALLVSADGGTFILATKTPQLTRDRGRTWIASSGLPLRARPIADRIDANRFYALDFSSGDFFTSTDGGSRFSKTPSTGLPKNLADDEPTSHEAAWPLMVTLGKGGDLWLVSKQGLFHSLDAGKTFSKTSGDLRIEAISFGKAPPGKTDPAIFAIASRGELKAIWRSDDSAQTWIRINDDQHQYGTRFRCIAGDPKSFGRVYVGTDGRGILYADPADTPR